MDAIAPYSATKEDPLSTYSPETNYGYRFKQFLRFILVERGVDGFYNLCNARSAIQNSWRAMVKILGIGLTLMLAVGLQADILYDSLTTGNSAVLPIGNGTTTGSVLYDSFSTGSVAEALTGLIVGLAPVTPPADPIVATLFVDNGSTPGGSIQITGGQQIGTLDDTLVTSSTTDYAINLSLNPILAANTRYWIALSGIGTVGWLRSTSSSGTGVTNELSDVGGLPVTANTSTFPFQMQIQATAPAAPEPSSLGSLAGLVALGLIRLRRKS